MEFRFYPFGELGSYKYADIVAVYEGKWIFCKHKGRTTWEMAGGHIEAGETPLAAAKRELFEETGAVRFELEPLCDYWVEGELGGVCGTAQGQVFFARVCELGELPEYSEMETVELFDEIPKELTYPELVTGIVGGDAYAFFKQKHISAKAEQ